MTISKSQLRAARVLLCLSQEELAALADVGVATIRRFETGHDVGALQVEVLRATVEAAGVVLLSGHQVGGQTVSDGVALVGEERMPKHTLDRIARRDRLDAHQPGRKAGRPPKTPPSEPESTPPEGT